ncbi:hypothetical protein [Weissella viridescens]|uniref:hypothetical protein n=1 Tax=Weissella viridescens TaxID=1629 RepID=UPI001FABBB2C|nr:hypothetical protein [Weissella viridescens]
MFKHIAKYSILLSVGVGAAMPLATVQGIAASKPEKITFWHSMTGETQKSIERVVNDFNKSQNDYKVVPEFQGQYVEALPKFLSVGGTKKAPVLF